MSDLLWYQYGHLSIYGLYSSVNGVSAPSGFNWGLVDQISLYGIQHAAVGQKVLFRGHDIIAKIKYPNGGQYTVISEDSILATAILP